MNRTWDVVVVGARVAGASTAMVLARAGLRVLCLDRSRYGSDTLSTHALMRGGVLQLQRWGLLGELAAAGTPAVRRTVFHYGDDAVAVSIKPSGGVDSLYAPRRTVLDSLLVEHATRAGVVFEFGTPVLDVHRNAAGEVAGVVVGDRRRGTARIVPAALVIGADGRASTIARAVDAPLLTVGRHAGSFLYGYWEELPTDGYEWFYRAGITAGTIPTNAGLTCVFIGAEPSVVAAHRGPPAAVFEQLAEPAGLSGRLSAAHRAESVRLARGLPAGYLRRSHGPGWALVGDAGHWLDPMSTHGMTAAVRDAALLSRAVLSAPPRSAALQEELTGFQEVRDRLSLPMLRATDEIAAYSWDLTRIRALLRSLSSAMTDEVETLAALTPAA